jgi:hypothetical protein
VEALRETFFPQVRSCAMHTHTPGPGREFAVILSACGILACSFSFLTLEVTKARCIWHALFKLNFLLLKAPSLVHHNQNKGRRRRRNQCRLQLR